MNHLNSLIKQSIAKKIYIYISFKKFYGKIYQKCEIFSFNHSFLLLNQKLYFQNDKNLSQRIIENENCLNNSFIVIYKSINNRQSKNYIFNNFE